METKRIRTEIEEVLGMPLTWENFITGLLMVAGLLAVLSIGEIF